MGKKRFLNPWFVIVQIKDGERDLETIFRMNQSVRKDIYLNALWECDNLEYWVADTILVLYQHPVKADALTEALDVASACLHTIEEYGEKAKAIICQGEPDELLGGIKRDNKPSMKFGHHDYFEYRITIDPRLFHASIENLLAKPVAGKIYLLQDPLMHRDEDLNLRGRGIEQNISGMNCVEVDRVPIDIYSNEISAWKNDMLRQKVLI